MSVPTHAQARGTLPLRANRRVTAREVPAQARWLLAGLVLAFGVPFVLADLAGLQRDLYYALYVAGVFSFVGFWARTTQQPVRAFLMRRWRWAVSLGVVAGALLTFTVLREPSTPHPHGLTFVGAILWRGVVYGAADGLLLSAFPIIATFGLFASKPLRKRSRAAVAGIGALAMVVSLLFTAVYHVGYSEFRGGKVARPLTGDMIWSVPTLLTLSPLGTPIAHVATHVTAVVHSYDTDLFLPPHDQER
jgi:hypothetical protein